MFWLSRFVAARAHEVQPPCACAQAIAYIRICRPGSVIGPQQTFLHINEAELWKHGELYRQQQKVRREKQRACKADVSNLMHDCCSCQYSAHGPQTRWIHCHIVCVHLPLNLARMPTTTHLNSCVRRTH